MACFGENHDFEFYHLLNRDQSLPRISQNITECIPVPSSEHVAEIVGRQGCKIKSLRAKTNTYIKTPVRGEEAVFVVTGRKEDVDVAKREILSAADHFTQIRASRRHSQGVSAAPGQVTAFVPVPYKLVGLVVGPKGATIKRIQQDTHTYIITPSRENNSVLESTAFQVTGLFENVAAAREQIERHIALRTGAGNMSACSKMRNLGLSDMDVTTGEPDMGREMCRSLQPRNTFSDSSMCGQLPSLDLAFTQCGGKTMKDVPAAGSSFLCSESISSSTNTADFHRQYLWVGDNTCVAPRSLSPRSEVVSGSCNSGNGFSVSARGSFDSACSFGSSGVASLKVASAQALNVSSDHDEGIYSVGGSPAGSPPSFLKSIEYLWANENDHLPPVSQSFRRASDSVMLTAGSSFRSNGLTCVSPPTILCNGISTSSLIQPESNLCTVCNANPISAASQPCEHKFCFPCAQSVFQASSRGCPVCYGAVSQVVPLA